MPYGCYNHAPHKDTVETVSVEPVLTPVNGAIVYTPRVVKRSWPIVFTRDCRYRLTELGKADPGCVGCKWIDHD